MNDYDDEPDAPQCPYCEAMGSCNHQVMHVDETFGEVEDGGAREEILEMVVKAVADALRSGRELPERLEENLFAGFMPFDPGDRPEPNEEAVRDWLMDHDAWRELREHYGDLLVRAGADECGYYPPAYCPGTASYCKSYYARATWRARCAGSGGGSRRSRFSGRNWLEGAPGRRVEFLSTRPLTSY